MSRIPQKNRKNGKEPVDLTALVVGIFLFNL